MKPAVILAAILGFGLPVFAQTITGSITGRVVDQQRSAVPNAAITVTEQSKNTVVTQKSNAAGDFFVAGLAPGTYSIAVEAAGFKKLLRSGVSLDANDKLALDDIELEVGVLTESVEVAATTVLLQTESVERSATITGKQMENIEVNGRNPLDMAKLVPGVVVSTNTSYAVGNSATGANNFSVNGARPSQNQLTLNGIGNVDTGNNGGMNVSVSLDSIAEFKILSGQLPGGIRAQRGRADFHGD
jgi:hypothetical protein